MVDQSKSNYDMPGNHRSVMGLYQRQRTLCRSISCIGVGLHTGIRVRMQIKSAQENTGIYFQRTDITSNKIPALWSNVSDSTLRTVLANNEGFSVATVEHLMAALHSYEIDNAIIEVNGPELPCMDGCSEIFVQLLEQAEIVTQNAPRKAIRILKPVQVKEQGNSAGLFPSESDLSSIFSFEIDFPNKVIAQQSRQIVLSKHTFKNDLSRARTFGFLKDVLMLSRQGLIRGGSLNNAVVIDEEKVLNAEGLRFEDEFVRHKLLDSIGDMYLAGGPILGHFIGKRSGHTLHHKLLCALFADQEAWCWETLPLVEKMCTVA